MIIEYRQKVKDLFEKVNSLKQEGCQNLPEYHEAFRDLQRNWDILKDLEQQQENNQLFEKKQVDLNLQSQKGNGGQNIINEHISRSTWSENQLYQLTHQVEAYKHLLQNKVVPSDVKEKISLQTPDDWAYRRALIHQQTQQFYEERFEQNHQLNYHDMWEYINKKLQNDGENFIKITSENHYVQSYIHHLNQIDESNNLKKELEKFIADESQPADERRKAEINLKMLQLQPLQKRMREDVLSRYTQNKIALAQYKADTMGDQLYERQLVDREFYKRAKIYSSNKKEARTLDRFEQQMRSGQELRKKTRHKEFLNEILFHAKEFQDFHKKRQNQIKKKVLVIKSSIESKGRKELMAEEKKERERIKLLREGDFTGYIDLINSEKNSRLLQILNQTQKYLEQLGAKVSLQKQENALLQAKKNNIEGENEEEKLAKENEQNFGQNDQDDQDMLNENDKIKANLKNSSKVYYSITHTVQEEIKEQPKMIKGGQLKSYQLIGLNWMVSLYNNNLNGILADEMGLGKTIQTISLFCYLIEKKGNEGPFLVVVPLTTISNWNMEFEKWSPDIRKIIYKGKKHERPLLAQHLKNDKYHVVLTTYEYILNDKSTLSKISWQYIIVDEGHRMKNQKSKFALTLGQQYSSAHRVLLTGTPLQNNISELWALLNFLLPVIFKSCEEFQKWFDKPLSKIHPVTNSKLTDQEKKAFELSEEEQLLVINRLHQVLRPFLLRRVKSEVEKELPNKIEIVIKVELSAWQKIVERGIKENGAMARDPSTGKIGNLALRNTVMQLRKICNHPYLFMDYFEPDDLRDNIYRVSGKFELLDRILPKFIRTGHKVLIFSQFTQLMDIMQYFFDFRGIKHLRLDGGTKHEDRSKNLQIFNDPDNEFPVFLLSTRAGGHGLNLQVADTVIIFDSDWNPQMDEQAKDRAHRIGQKREVRVYRLITTTKIEEDILTKATMKKDLDAKIIQAGMFNEKASDIERQKKLEDLIRKDYEEDDQEQDSEIPNDDQLNEIVSRSPEEYEIFTQMDQERYKEENMEDQIAEIKSRTDKRYHGYNINYRLMQEWEVPEWVKIKPEDPSKNIQEFGLGKRQRKQVNYSDGISEGQWLRMIEAGADQNEINQEIERRKKKKENRANEEENQSENSLSKRRKMMDYGNSYDDYDQEDEEDASMIEPKRDMTSNSAHRDKVTISIGKQTNQPLQEDEKDDDSFDSDDDLEEGELIPQKQKKKSNKRAIKNDSAQGIMERDLDEDEQVLVSEGEGENKQIGEKIKEIIGKEDDQQSASGGGRAKRRAAPTDLKEK